MLAQARFGKHALRACAEDPGNVALCAILAMGNQAGGFEFDTATAVPLSNEPLPWRLIAPANRGLRLSALAQIAGVAPQNATLSAFFPDDGRLLPGGRRAGLVVVGVGHKEELPKRPRIYFGFQRDEELRVLRGRRAKPGWRVFVVDPEDHIKLLLQGAIDSRRVPTKDDVAT